MHKMFMNDIVLLRKMKQATPVHVFIERKNKLDWLL